MYAGSLASESEKVLMGWATGHIERLKAGQTVQFRPRGNSMVGKVRSGQLCTVEPVGDPVRLRVSRSQIYGLCIEVRD